MDGNAYFDVISGKQTGAAAAMFRGLLAGLSPFYAAAVRARNRAYDLGLKRVHRAAVPVLSVGNLTTGGTGKTPFVAWLTQWFRERRVKVALLSRGYCSLSPAGNDEKLLLDRLCPDVPHFQDPDRVAAAERACRECDPDLLILDDGFQHRRLARDLNIVLIDALNPWGYGHCLPRGLLREPVTALRRAEIVVLTRADQVSADNKQAILERVQTISPALPCVEAAFTPRRLVNADGKTHEFAALDGTPVGAVCGIGNPDGFRRTLAECGVQDADCRFFRAFPDHHHYDGGALNAVTRLIRENDPALLLTTQKDLVKLDRTELADVPLWAVEIGMRLLGERSELEDRLQVVARSPDRATSNVARPEFSCSATQTRLH